MVERHRRADAVVLGGLQAHRHAHPVVEQVVVRQHHALGRTGGAGGVLNVSDVVRLGGALVEVAAACQHSVPRIRAKPDDVFELQRFPGARFLQNVAVIGARILLVQKQGADSGLAQHVAQLVRAVRRIDVDQHHAGPRSGVLQQHPLGAVAGPDAGTIARPQAESGQTARHPGGLCVQLAPGQADVLMTHDQRVAAGELRGGIVQRLRNGFLKQGHNRPARITEAHHW